MKLVLLAVASVIAASFAGQASARSIDACSSQDRTFEQSAVKMFSLSGAGSLRQQLAYSSTVKFYGEQADQSLNPENSDSAYPPLVITAPCSTALAASYSKMLLMQTHYRKYQVAIIAMWKSVKLTRLQWSRAYVQASYIDLLGSQVAPSITLPLGVGLVPSQNAQACITDRTWVLAAARKLKKALPR